MISSCTRVKVERNSGSAFSKSFALGKEFKTKDKTDSALILLNQSLSLTNSFDSLVLVYLELGDIYRLTAKFNEALQMLHKFDSVFNLTEPKDSLLYAESKHLSGKLHSDKGSFEEALRQFNLSLGIKSRWVKGLSLTQAKTYNYIGIAYFYQHQFDKAMENYKMAEAVCDSLGIFDKDIAHIYQNLGIVHSVKGNFEEAIRYLNLSREIRENNPELKEDLWSFYFNYGYFLYSIGESSKSILAYKRAEELLIQYQKSNSGFLANLYINIGNAYYQRGDFEKARVYYANVINELEKKLDLTHPNLITARNNLGFIYFRTGNFKDAQQMFSESLKVVNNPETRVFLLRNIAKSKEALGEMAAAEEYFIQALNESIDKLGSNHVELSGSYLAAGEFFYRIDRLNVANEMFHKSLDILEKFYPANKTGIGNVKIRIADILVAHNDFHGAEKTYLEAIGGFVATGVESAGNFDIRLKDAYFGLADLYRNRFPVNQELIYLEKSLDYYKTGIGFIENLGMNITDESRMLLNQDSRQRMVEAIAVCYELLQHTGNDYYIDLAFDFSSRSKAAVLLSSVKRNIALEFGGVPLNIISKEVAMREELSVVQKLLFNEQQKKRPSAAQLAYLDSRQFTLVNQYDSLIEQLSKQYPDYFSLRHNNQVISVSDVQKRLGSNEVLIDYAFQDSYQFLVAVSQTEKKLVKLTAVVNAHVLLQDLLLSLKPDFSALSGADLTLFADRSHKLFQHLLKPVDSMINNKDLIIIPDGQLGYLPFEALLSREIDQTARNTYSSLPYLLFSNNVSYTYSASIRFNKRETKKTFNGKVVAFVPDYSRSGQETDVKGLSISTSSLQELIPLPFAKYEAESVLGQVKGKLLPGKKASKQNFLDLSNNYDVLHLAMHTQINDDNPLYSRLIFHPDRDSVDLFTLSTYELYNLKLDASMVVLSACNTGSGSLQQGEGVMSLTRGFIFAGVPSIVMTTWEVQDEAGAMLMDRFYYHLRLGASKDEALRKSKIEFLSESNLLKSHPYFWSSYVLIGDTSPIYLEPTQSSYLVIVLSATSAIILIFIIVIIRRNKKRNYFAPEK
ncbi:MAG: CHAT domain-containing protein [Bacteroidales bacterium]|nr:CHAT domain-containing protein [Bacteroidales bacterium]